MSRSYKKVQIYGDTPSKSNKRYANHLIRRMPVDDERTLQNGSYRKKFESWEICDFKVLEPDMTFEKYKEKYNYNNLSDKELKREYYKIYRNK